MLEFTRNQKLALCAIAGICSISLSAIFGRHMLSTRGGVVIRQPGQAAEAGLNGSDPIPALDGEADAGKVVFQVAGAVRRPSVYSLPSGRRVIDAIEAAGGAITNADLQSLNLAAKIGDGERIYVPTVQETMMQRVGTGRPVVTAGASAMQATAAASTHGTASGDSGGTEKLKTPGQGTVALNSAGPDELQRLPGVGPATAEKIMEYRSQVGRFTSVEQLMDVKGIGPKKMEKMRPFVRL